MAHYYDIASDLLRETADFIERVCRNSDNADPAMLESAGVFRHMADLVRDNPEGSVEHLTHAEMAARLLEDARAFFLSVAQNNPMIAEQMQGNAEFFIFIAGEMRKNPMAIVPDGDQGGSL